MHCSSQCVASRAHRAARGVSTPNIPVLRRKTRLYAGSDSSGPTYQGVYGPWKLTDEDTLEVYGYRAGLGVSATGLVVAGLGALLPGDSPVSATLQAVQDAALVSGALGFGASLLLIHMYAGSIKRAMQVFWGVGVAGGLYLLATQDAPVAAYVADHREAVWLVGPFFAAITGLGVKEGLCYGKPEAALLAGLTPLLLLGHLTGVLPRAVEDVLVVACLGAYATLAARKWTQEVKDDVGDKSIFEFQKLSEDEQRALLERMGRLSE